MLSRIAVKLALLAVLAGPALCQADMVVFGHDTQRHERFANHADFVGSTPAASFDLDFSGVARGTNGFWATMISSTHFVSAAHAPASGAVSFYHTNDPTGAKTDRTIVGGGRIGGTDIWVGELNAPINPLEVAIYTIAADTLTDYVGDVFYQAGRGPSMGADNTTGFRVGRNVVSSVFEDVVLGSAVTDSLIFFDDSPAGDLTGGSDFGPEFITDETFLVGGDSGGPSFLVSGSGELLLLGTHSFVTGPDPDDPLSPFSLRRASGDAYLPAYRSQILAAVPEASPLLAIPLVAGFTGTFALVRARRTRNRLVREEAP